MAKFKITDPQSGKTVTISGDSAPTQQEAEEIFNAAGLRNSLPPQPQDLGGKILKGVGEAAPVVLPLVAGAAGAIAGPVGSAVGAGAGTGAGLAVKRSIEQLQGRQTQTPGQLATESVVAPLAAGALDFVGGKALNLAGKVLNPFKTIGEYRAAKILELEGKKIAGDDLIVALEKGTEKISPTMKTYWDKTLAFAKQMYGGKELTIDQVVNLNTTANQAFTAAGKTGKGATAMFNRVLGDELKRQLEINAPKVALANKMFKLGYGAEKFVKRLPLPTSIAIGLGLAGRK